MMLNEDTGIEDAGGQQVTFSSIIAALSYALDLTEGAAPGHAVRSCLLGMRIGESLGLSQHELSDLYYALLLKDAGCSSNATRLHQIVGGDEIRAKRLSKTIDYEKLEWKQISFILKHVHSKDRMGGRLKAIGSMIRHSKENAKILIHLRCEQGAMVVRDLGLGQGTADAIYNLDEHWNGVGYPDKLAGAAIPLLARIVSLAQTLEVFYTDYGPAAALDVIQRRSGRWFDPEVVRATVALIRQGGLWDGLDSEQVKEHVAGMEPRSRAVKADAGAIDNICTAFAGVIDAKSHSTYMHSTEVARIAVGIGECMGLPQEELTTLRRAGLLHDIGKLSVPNSILDKPGRLTAEEWGSIKMHPHYTFEILNRIPGFGEIATVAASHHEKLDGSGYYRGLKAEELSTMSRVLMVADMFEALSANRPYRGAMMAEDVLAVMRRDAPHAVDASCLDALQETLRANVAKLAFEVPPAETAAELGEVVESLGLRMQVATATAS